jgi:hypothetical protein
MYSFNKYSVIDPSLNRYIKESINKYLNKIKEQDIIKQEIKKQENKSITKFVKSPIPYESGFTNCFHDWSKLDPSYLQKMKSKYDNDNSSRNNNYIHFYLYFISSGLFFFNEYIKE